MTHLQALSAVCGLPAAQEFPLQPLLQLRTDLLQALQLHMTVEACLQAYLPLKAIQVEMQVAAILGWMERDGMGEQIVTPRCLVELHMQAIYEKLVTCACVA